MLAKKLGLRIFVIMRLVTSMLGFRDFLVSGMIRSPLGLGACLHSKKKTDGKYYSYHYNL